MMTLEPVLTPHGLLTLRQTAQASALESDQGLRLEKAFLRGSGHGLLWLGADEVATVLPPVLSYWMRERSNNSLRFARRVIEPSRCQNSFCMRCR